MEKTYRYISADSHFESPPETWRHRVPKQYHDRLPRRIKLPDGRDALQIEGEPLIYGGTSLFGGRSPEEFDPTILDFEHTPGCGSAEQRLREQDQDGVDAEVLFALGVRNPNIKDTDTLTAITRGFNSFMAEEYCATDPRRLIGVGILPNRGVDNDIKEMELCKKMGFKAVWLTGYPNGTSFPTAEDDRFWAASLDLDMRVVVHVAFRLRVGGRGVPLLNYPNEPKGERRPPTDFVQRLARMAPYNTGAVEGTQLVVTGVFDRFPKLEIYWAENNIGWIPYFYEQMDAEYEVNRFWVQRTLGLPKLKQRPSEYFKQHAYWGYWEDKVGLDARHEIGVDRMMWSTDFPHLVTRWPHSVNVAESQMASIPEEEKKLLVAENAATFFNLN